MARELYRLTQSLYNKPHLITAESLDGVVSYLEDRNNRSIEFTALENTRTINNELNYYDDAKLGFLTLDGPLTYVQYHGMCGPSGPSYQAIRQDFDRMVEAGAKTIVMDLDTPGGEAYASFETARYLRDVADEKGIKLLSYIDGTAASAGYLFAAVAHEIIANPMAQIGSIGAVVKLRNTNKAMKNMGVTDTYVYSGSAKIPFNEEGEFTKEFIADVQYKIDKAYETFVSHVAEYRGLSEQEVINTEAKVFTADDALKLGLVDKLMSLNEFSEYLTSIVGNEEEKMPIGNKFFNKNKEDRLEMSSNTVELEAQLQTLKEQFEQSQTQASVELAAMVEQVTQLTSSLATKEVELTSALEQVKLLHEEKELSKASARKEKLAAVLPECKVEAVSASLSNLDDDAFEVVLEGYQASANALKQSPLLEEIGSEGQEIESDEVAQDGTLQAIRSKLNINQ